MTMPQLSRRQALTVAGVSLGVGVVELGMSSSPASAADPTPILEPVGDQPVSVLSGTGAAPAVCPRQLAVKVIRSTPLPAGSRISVTFDPRLYAPAQPAIVTLNGRGVAAGTTTTTDPATGLRSCTVELTETVPSAGDLLVVVGTAHPLLYPRDMVRTPADASAEMRSARGGRSRRSLQPRRPSSFGGPAAAWGVELSGTWARKTWGDGGRFRYDYPLQVTLRGAGPGKSPSSLLFGIAVDPQVVGDIQVASARFNGQSRAGAVRPVSTTRRPLLYQATWAAALRLGPDDVLDVSLRVSTLTPVGPLSTIKYPVIEVLSTTGATTQRRTGRESLSRSDAVWE
ncbi:hypothetical protein ACFYPG_11630 [Micromonospora sp. NPDC005553]|uniref:hypothetical protein n=1 Tax=unclassified Micromonospora TaxID=2617518 RepID=UPI0033A085A3